MAVSPGSRRTWTSHSEDHSERAERARQQFGEVVPVLLLAAARARSHDPAVAEGGGDPDDLVGDCPETVAERSGVAGRDHAADGRCRTLPQPKLWIHGEHQPASAQDRLCADQRRAGVERRDDAVVVDDDAVEMSRQKTQRMGWGGPAPAELRTAADNADCAHLCRRARERGGCLAEAARHDGLTHRRDTARNVIATAIPARPRDPGKAPVMP